ncbi:hypothetical protein SBA5_670008 [Candidatus Sulfotelmatomonas gaucii]|uniref:DUF5681 domain-containing protein n=1 Tax=Candidatus Sulfuritelmatomonas gaucii TaxID=2043161 RepID=A0A2N9LZD9_9BACT|nr:hypothetical protein SBA5_670008 [Candidatus Sulfotelmatomonas gaucii]
MADENAPYTVGYGKPPSEGRFQKGHSGNPKGRPKGSKNLAGIVLREARQKVRINSSRGTRTVTKAEATVLQFANKSIQGDLRAGCEFIALIERSEESANSGTGSLQIGDLDRQVLENLRRRMTSLQSANTKPNGKVSE